MHSSSWCKGGRTCEFLTDRLPTTSDSHFGPEAGAASSESQVFLSMYLFSRQRVGRKQEMRRDGTDACFISQVCGHSLWFLSK